MRPAGIAAILWVTGVSVFGATRPVCAQDGVAGRSGETPASLAPGMAIYADLNSGLDSKKLKPGDAVTAHTIEAVRSSDARTILPRGTKLVGHIALASAKSKGDPQSALGLAFDKAILKDGGEVALTVRIQAMAAPISYGVAAASDAGPPQSTTSMGTTQTSPMSSSTSAGRTGPPPSTPPPGVPAGSDPGGPVLGPSSRGMLGMRGLTLTTAPMENLLVSTVSSEGKNVHLDGGTRMLLVTQANAPETPTQ